MGSNTFKNDFFTVKKLILRENKTKFNANSQNQKSSNFLSDYAPAIGCPVQICN